MKSPLVHAASLLVATYAVAGAQPATPAKAAATVATGTITGKVKAAKGGTTANSVVYLTGKGLPLTPLKEKAIRQKGKQFSPPVMVVTGGTAVDFPNDDRVMHNVFSLSSGNAFDLGHYKKGDSRQATFSKAGVVDIYCNIHPNMVATVLVVDNDFFVAPAADGSFSLPNVPIGTYEINVWTPNTKPVTQQIKVTAGKQKGSVDLQLPAQTERLGDHTDKQGKPYGPGISK